MAIFERYAQRQARNPAATHVGMAARGQLHVSIPIRPFALIYHDAPSRSKQDTPSALGLLNIDPALAAARGIGPRSSWWQTWGQWIFSRTTLTACINTTDGSRLRRVRTESCVRTERTDC